MHDFTRDAAVVELMMCNKDLVFEIAAHVEEIVRNFSTPGPDGKPVFSDHEMHQEVLRLARLVERSSKALQAMSDEMVLFEAPVWRLPRCKEAALRVLSLHAGGHPLPNNVTSLSEHALRRAGNQLTDPTPPEAA